MSNKKPLSIILKSLVFLACLFIILIFAFIVALPTIVSTDTGKNFLIEQLNRCIPGKISVDSLNMRWTQGQSLKHLKMWDPQGQLIVSIEDFSTDLSLFSVLLGKNNVGETTIRSPFLHLIKDAQGNTNLESAFYKEPKQPSKKSSLYFQNITGNIRLSNGEMILESPLIEPVFIKDFNADFFLPRRQEIKTFYIHGLTKQGEVSGNFSLDGSAHIREGKITLFSSKKNERAHLLVNIEHLPTAALDHFFRFNFQQTLGPEITVNAQWDATEQNATFSTHIHSLNLQAELYGLSNAEFFLLQKPSNLSLKVTPELSKKFLNLWNIHIPNDFAVHLKMEEAKIPLNYNEWQSSSFNSTYQIEPFEINEHAISSIVGNIFSTSLGQSIAFDYQGMLSDHLGSFDGRVEFKHLSQLDFEGTVKDFPIDTNLSPYLGNRFSCSYKGMYEHKKTWIEGDFITPIVETKSIKLLISDNVLLLEPTLVYYRALPEVIKDIRKESLIVCHIKRFQAPLEHPFDLNFISLEGSLNADSIYFSQASFKNLKIDVSGSSLAQPLLSFNTLIVNAHSDLDIILGQTIELHGQTQLLFEQVQNQWNFHAPLIEAHFAGSQMEGTVIGEVTKDHIFELKQPSYLKGVITQESFATFFDKEKYKITIQEPAKASIILDSLSFPFSFTKKNIQLHGEADIPHLYLNSEEAQAHGSFDHIKMAFDIHSANNNAHFSLAAHSSVIYTKEQPITYKGNILASTDVKNFVRPDGQWEWSRAHYSFDVAINDFPTALLDSYSEYSDIFSSLLGPTLSVHLSSYYVPTKDEEGLLEIVATSEGFEASLAIELNEILKIHPIKPSTIHWDLTPRRYQFLQNMMRTASSSAKTDFTLLQPASIDIKITELTCPATATDKISSFLCQSGLVANIHVSPMLMMNQVSKEKVTVQNLYANVNGKDFSEKIHVDFGGKLQNPEQDASFNFVGDLENAWTKTGKFNHEHLSAIGTLSLNQLSVPAMTGIIPMEPATRSRLRALLGSYVDATIFLHISELAGPINIDVTSTNFKANILAQLGDGYLTLRDQVTAEVHLTEELSETLLKDVSPLLITAAQSSTPIRLYIDPEGFAVPVKSFVLRNVNVNKAVIDLGKVRVRNGGNMQSLMHFLKGKGVSDEGEMDAWFTPIFMSLKDGVAIYRRFDALLANNVHIASWGRIDLNKNKVNMVLGISPETMKSAFGISGLTDEYMFQIKMKGPPENVVIDWKSASTRIGVLMARTLGGSAGLLIGKLFDLIRNVLGDQKTPQPTTQPFPWSKDAPPRPTEIPIEHQPPKPRKTHKKEEPIENPLSEFNLSV